MKECSHCGQLIKDIEDRCPTCGKSIISESSDQYSHKNENNTWVDLRDHLLSEKENDMNNSPQYHEHNSSMKFEYHQILDFIEKQGLIIFIATLALFLFIIVIIFILPSFKNRPIP